MAAPSAFLGRHMVATVTIAEPVEVEGRMTCERALFARQIEGEPIGSLSTLHLPAAARTLREVAFMAVKILIREKEKQGFEPLDEPGAFRMFGPYRYRGFADGPRQAGGRAEGEDTDLDSADFVLVGQMLATVGYPTEVATYDDTDPVS